MKAYTREVADKLNVLLSKIGDSEKGFVKASENAEAKSLVDWFMERALERKRFGDQLKWEIGFYAQDSDQRGTMAGGLHGAWMDLRIFLINDDDKALLEEAIRGEQAALDEYSEILKEEKIPPSAFALLVSQRAHIAHGLSILLKTKALEFSSE